MIVKMKMYEKLAMDFAKQYKNWELQCLAKDVYLAAYRQGIKDGDINLTKEVEVEFKDGEHQLIDWKTN